MGPLQVNTADLTREQRARDRLKGGDQDTSKQKATRALSQASRRVDNWTGGRRGAQTGA